MNGGAFLKVLLVLGLLAGGGFVYEHNVVTKLRKEFSDDSDTLKGFQRQLSDRVRELDSVKERTSAAFEKVRTNESLSKKKADLTQALSDLGAQQRKAVADFAAVIQRVRAAGVGMEIPELKLASGAVLKNAKIEKVAESEMLVSHAGGVSRLSTKDIPSDLLVRFRFGDPVMTGETPVAPTSGQRAATPSKTSDAAPISPPAPVAPAAAKPVNVAALENQMFDFRTKVGTLQAQIAAAEKQRDEYKREAASYLSKHAMNRMSTTYVDASTGLVVSSSGGRSDSYNITAKEYEKKAADLDARITQAKIQVATMESEIGRLQAQINR